MRKTFLGRPVLFSTERMNDTLNKGNQSTSAKFRYRKYPTHFASVDSIYIFLFSTTFRCAH